MAQIRYGANLSSAEFPFLSYKKARSVIIPQEDQQYIPGVTTDPVKERQAFIPDLFYCHNVMPTPQGWQSVGYQSIVSNFILPTVNEAIIDTVKVTESTSGLERILAITNLGRVFVTVGPTGFNDNRQPTYEWGVVNTFTDLTLSSLRPILTAAFVNGVQYVFINGNGTDAGCYYLDSAGSLALIKQTLNGITDSNFTGITSSNGYMLIWYNNIASKTGVLWSSLIDPTDFSPSLITGAGGGDLQEAQSEIVFCASIKGGFIAYTKLNIVAASYTQNAYYPFNFQSISNGGGITDNHRVATENTGDTHYLYGTKGLQAITLTACLSVFPAATEFITRKQLEDFDERLLRFTEIELTGGMNVAVSYNSGRYLVLSYGPNADTLGQFLHFSYALINDTLTGRWGKLKISHQWAHTLSPELQTDPSNVSAAKNSMVFMDNIGGLQVVDWDIEEITSTPTNPGNGGGVAIFGKYQLERSNLMQLETVTVEGVAAADSLTLYDAYSINGSENISIPILLSEALSTENMRIFPVHLVAINHSLIFVGKFDLTTMILNCFNHGRR